MSFVVKHEKAFEKGGENYYVIPRRSEGRLKTYSSATDSRSWASEFNKREYLLDLILKQPRKCGTSGLIPENLMSKIIKSCCSGETYLDTKLDTKSLGTNFKNKNDAALFGASGKTRRDDSPYEEGDQAATGGATRGATGGASGGATGGASGGASGGATGGGTGGATGGGTGGATRGGTVGATLSPEEEKSKRLAGEAVATLSPEEEELKRFADEAVDKLTLMEDVCEERDCLQKLFGDAQKEIQSLKSICNTLECEKDKMESEALEEKEEECMNLREKCQMLQDELENVAERDDDEDDLDNLKAELSKLRKELSCACNQIEKQARIIEDLKTERNMLRIKANTETNDVIQRLRERAECAEDRLQNCGDNEQALKAACAKLNQMDKIKQEKDDLQCKYTSAIRASKDLELKNCKSNNCVKKLEELNRRLSEKYQKCQKCLCEREEEIERLVMEIKRITTARDKGQKQIERCLTKICCEMENKNLNLNKSSTRLSCLQQEMEGAIQKTKCEALDLKCKLSELEIEVDDLRKKIQLKTRKINGLFAQVEERDKTIECLKSRLGKKEQNKKNYQQLGCECGKMGDQLRNITQDTQRMETCANELSQMISDKELLDLLQQSRCTVKKLSKELKENFK